MNKQNASPSNGVEPILIDDWHVIADLESLYKNGHHRTRLFDIPISMDYESNVLSVIRTDSNAKLTYGKKYGYLWATLGKPTKDIVSFPECEELDRYLVTGGSIAVHVSGLRAVENFLDMGHFPFVHKGYLGIESKSEVFPYEVSVDKNNWIIADGCSFFQPVASPVEDGGMDAEYIYKVARPYTVMLYKTNPIETDRWDFIALFVQPVDQEHCVAHPLLAYLKHDIDEPTIRWYMQVIFAQDKPILESQQPKRLPLGSDAELSVIGDKTSVMYRRWLREQGVNYGTTQDG